MQCAISLTNTCEVKHLPNLSLDYVIINNVNDIQLCEEADHVPLISEQARGRPTWSVRAA